MENSGLLWTDWAVFLICLCLSAGISLYYGFFKRKQNTVEEYLFGSKNMPTFPICMSNMASLVSSITFIAMPTEAYYYGAQLLFMCLGILTAEILLYNFYLPVFYRLGYTSLFEYLEKRFNRPTRCFASTVFSITQMLYLLVVVFTACTAVSRALGVPFHIFTPFACIFCTVYTLLSGLRGVVWADTLQSAFMFSAVVILIFIGVWNAGGIANVVDIADRGSRLHIFNFDPSPFTRNSAWMLYIGTLFLAMYNSCTNPAIIQRYLSLPNYSQTKIVVITTATATLGILSLAILLGLVIYATYYNCDPGLSKGFAAQNELVPFFVVDIGRNIPGVTGLFLAGILSAALSTMSTVVNTISGTTSEDLIKPLLRRKLTDSQMNLCIKSVVTVFGLIITAAVFGLNTSGGVFQGAIIGSLVGILVTVTLGLGNQAAITSGQIKYIHKVITVEGCPGNLTQSLGLNATTVGYNGYETPVTFADDVPYPFRISFNLTTTIGVIVSLIVGCLVSHFTEPEKLLDENLIIPQIRTKKPILPGYDVVPSKELKQITTVPKSGVT
ncbi:sodium-coupled monocarboxylate transporter 1-like isoform X2 [Rhodnius prolixus]|uniref:sodium-coupled monocarboxylate transporter 1-like isoform X2 n=1 Tax=Rhodnius prolixus TaxID=13249 RepID=UPI003D18900F